MSELSVKTVSLFEDLTKELVCDELGVGYATLRGLARMCGLASRSSWGKGGRKFTLEIDEYLTESGFRVAAIDISESVPDYIAAEVIGFYAEEKQNPIAKQFSRAFRAYGLRKVIQDMTGYSQPQPTPQPEEKAPLLLESAKLPPEVRRRNLKEMDDAVTPGTALYERLKNYRNGRRGGGMTSVGSLLN